MIQKKKKKNLGKCHSLWHIKLAGSGSRQKVTGKSLCTGRDVAVRHTTISPLRYAQFAGFNATRDGNEQERYTQSLKNFTLDHESGKYLHSSGEKRATSVPMKLVRTKSINREI
jgi:hypothetical protein